MWGKLPVDISNIQFLSVKSLKIYFCVIWGSEISFKKQSNYNFHTVATIRKILLVVVMGTMVYILTISSFAHYRLTPFISKNLHYYGNKFFFLGSIAVSWGVVGGESVLCSHSHLLLWYYCVLNGKCLKHHESL